jgi:prepilin-type N-terminal cleavage/methylation domain-containing protein
MNNTIGQIRCAFTQRAFSLIEVAVVIVILTVLLSGLALPIAAQVQMRRYEETRKLMEESREAILGFASANGRLPCPATADSNGRESFCSSPTGVCAPTTVPQSHGRCSNFHTGYLPGSTLGLAPLDNQGFVLDGWLSRMRYAVRDSGAEHSLTAVGGIKSTSMTTLSGRDYLLLCGTANGVTENSCGSAPLLTDKAPFLLLSAGPNPASPSPGPDEAENTDDDIVFVARDPSPDFDDIVTWVSLHTLFSRLIAAGKLP